MQSSRLAVLIPIYNPGDKLRGTLAAMAAMEHGDIVIVNDGGREDVSGLREALGVDFTLVELPSNVGITKALNAGLKHCLDNGYEFVARIDAGDIPVNDRFVKQMAYLDQHPDCQLVGCQVEIRNMEGGFEFLHANPTASRDLKKAMYTRNAFFHCSVMFRTSIVRAIGGYDESYLVAQDYEFFFRISNRYEVGLINEVLVYDLYNPNGISYSRRGEQLRAKLRAQLKYFSPFILQSYVGIAKSIAIIALPDRLVWEAKKVIKNRLAAGQLKRS